jgi:hypothetical protein
LHVTGFFALHIPLTLSFPPKPRPLSNPPPQALCGDYRASSTADQALAAAMAAFGSVHPVSVRAAVTKGDALLNAGESARGLLSLPLPVTRTSKMPQQISQNRSVLLSFFFCLSLLLKSIEI